jgi:hypothetical protein
MKTSYVLSALVLAGGIALAAPGFAQDRSYGDGIRAGTFGMDVAPGGGSYSRQDVANEAPDRMSHPVPGEQRAPSNIAKGSLADVDAAENAETARLNGQQLNGGGQTASLPASE